MRIFLAPPIDNKPLQESLKNLGAKQKQIDAWMIAVNNYKHMKLSSQEILQENNSQELLQELSIPPNNWDAVRLFILLATQWRINGTKPIGIDYSAIEPTARLAEIKVSQLIFEKIRFMEQTTLEMLSGITEYS